MPIRHLLLVAALAVSGCALMTDAATRLANDIVSNAGALKSSAETERTFTHQPAATPSGCAGAYQVTLDSGGGLAIGCDIAYPKVSFTTSSHRNAVTTPATLQISKKAGEALTVTLRKNGNVIELVAIQ